MQILPSIALSGFIRHYLFLKKESPGLSHLRLFSDGNTGIVFHNGQQLTQNGQQLPESFIYGQITDYKDIISHGPSELFIIVFRPDGFSRLLQLPAGELKDSVIPLKDCIGAAIEPLLSSVQHSNTIAEKIAATESFLKNLSPGSNPLITASLDFIQKQQGQITIGKLSEFTGAHPRQLERKFTTAIGLPPKKFAGIVRIQTFLKDLTKQNLTRSAYDSGFYDQAHLIREFKGFTGLTPSQYLKKTAPLAVNFLQLPR